MNSGAMLIVAKEAAPGKVKAVAPDRRIPRIPCAPSRDCLLGEARSIPCTLAQAVAQTDDSLLIITASHYVSTGRDVTERVASSACLEHQATHDALTGLPNRSLFLDRLAQALRRAQREMGQVALLFIDLDRFKQINDSHGHEVGDRALIRVAERLQEAVRDQDSVARIGGDEFAVVLEGLKTPTDSSRVAEKLVAAFDTPLDVDGHVLDVGASIGIATFPEDGDEMELLQRRADLAMYQVKSHGRSGYAHFKEAMEGERLASRSMAMAMSEALANGEFDVHYQTILDPRDHRVLALEALLRWDSPRHGTVEPSRFLPMLESNRQIMAVGKWFLAEACDHFKSLMRPDLPRTVLAVNLSRQQFRDTHLLDDIETILRERAFDPKQLQLEISESVLIENPGAAGRVLGELKALGVRLAIDDFGTGCTSLRHLQHFPIDLLKIDHSLIADLEFNAHALWMVKTIIKLADSLDIECSAEGVETEGQLALLAALGCHQAQGFWFNRPVPIRQLRCGWLAHQPNTTEPHCI